MTPVLQLVKAAPSDDLPRGKPVGLYSFIYFLKTFLRRCLKVPGAIRVISGIRMKAASLLGLDDPSFFKADCFSFVGLAGGAFHAATCQRISKLNQKPR